LLIGNLLAYAAMQEGQNVTYMPSYGVEMRGGTVNCTVVISSEQIGSPVVGRPLSAIIMNQPSLERFEPTIMPGGLLLLNTSLVDPKLASRTDIEVISIPMNKLAEGNGDPKLANMVALGAYVEKTKVVSLKSIIAAFPHVLAERYHSLIPTNVEAVQLGSRYMKDYGGK